MVKRFFLWGIASCLTLIAIAACVAPVSPPAAPLRFAHNLWPGYFPLTLAQEWGFFEQEGVAIELIFNEDQQPQIADFSAGRYDGMAVSLQRTLPGLRTPLWSWATLEKGIAMRMFLAAPAKTSI